MHAKPGEKIEQLTKEKPKCIGRTWFSVQAAIPERWKTPPDTRCLLRAWRWPGEGSDPSSRQAVLLPSHKAVADPPSPLLPSPLQLPPIHLQLCSATSQMFLHVQPPPQPHRPPTRHSRPMLPGAMEIPQIRCCPDLSTATWNAIPLNVRFAIAVFIFPVMSTL